MKNLDEIRKDLKDVQFYMPRQDKFKLSIEMNYEPIVELKNKANLYCTLIKGAPRRIEDVFNGLYIQGNTQKKLGLLWNVSEKYIQILNKRLIVYLQSKL